MRRGVKFKGQLKLYMRWPMFLIVLLLAMNVAMYALDKRAGILMTIFVCIYAAIVVVLYYYNKQIFVNEMINFATGYGQIQKKLLQELEIPYTLLDENGRVIWMNTAFKDLVGKNRDYKKSITNLFPTITKDKFPVNEEATKLHISVDTADYRVEMHKIMMEHIAESVSLLETEEFEGYLIAVYLFDETELNRYIKANKEQQLVAGLIYIDNYDEVIEGVEEVRSSLLVALIDRKINKYISGIDGIVKKMEKDKYFVVMKQVCLEQLEAKRFELLDDVKTVSIGNEIPITLSIGLGVGGNTYIQNYEYARNAIDLALGRGGDQAIVKRKDKIVYYGGKSKQVEKNTRVKARVKAQALRELIENKDKVMVMGHKIGDVDSFGAAIGIYRAAKTMNKRTHVVINEITTSVRKMIDGFIDNPDYEEDMFLNSVQAKEIIDNNTLLVVVDVNRPSYTECPELLNMCKTIVVLDHHRQTAEVIDNAVLSYVEPYASSACEMVAEILQYIDDNVKIRSMEADCLYAGIIIDTDSFVNKTGVRTFEAAAFLRRNGADVTRVRKMFRDDMAEYKARAEIVRNAEVYLGSYAISVLPETDLDSPTIIGAKAANELLNIVGVKASFVLTDFSEKVYISARSIDEVNVQIIMEKLGGGGHLSVAGAQLQCDVNEAVQRLKDTLSEMIEKGEI
ncbi:MAG: DHH family phosphoesterase [Lachnospiraceae bacterium]|nr:DHH family phosphoesterase [Lachnospiraceae bacterium]